MAICSTVSLHVPGCPGTANYENKNPYWYKFTCFKSGTLGFVIDPNDAGDDYDWQLYDITGLDPNEVFTNRNIIVTGNWAGNPGPTGTSASGVDYIQCASPYNGTESRFAKMPNLKEGHEYILLVSHFTNSQSGYKLNFSGGTAVITDPTEPGLKSVSTSCDASKIYLKLSKMMRCSSIAPDGSDFQLSNNGMPITDVKITGIEGAGCANGFDTDSITILLSSSLRQGSYQLSVKTGNDGNSLLDNCNRSLEEGANLSFEVFTLLPTPMDSLVPPACSPSSLKLIFKKKILCGTIASNGSNFKISGPKPVNIMKADGDCDGEATFSIYLSLEKPIVNEGRYTITLQPGSFGNAILDECGQEIPIGSTLSFDIKDTVSAGFRTKVGWGCKTDTIHLHHDGKNKVNFWDWTIDKGGKSNLQSPAAYFKEFGEKTIGLKVSNGFCSDSSFQKVLLDNHLKAGFEVTNMICPEDSVIFENKCEGKITSWEWNFNNGATSFAEAPGPQKYPLSGFEKDYEIQLVVKNHLGCADTATQKVRVLKSCYIAVPSAFSPNGDGINDYLYPLNAFKANNLKFNVYSRSGQLVYSSTDWRQKWDGTYQGYPLDSEMFVWTLQYTHADNGKKYFLKGTSLLIR